MRHAPESIDRGGAALPVALLGVNLWSVAVALPLALGEPRSPTASVVIAAATLVPLVAGLWALRRPGATAQALLLVVFPVSIALAVGAAPFVAAEPLGSPMGTVLSALSLAAFGAATAAAVGREPRLRPSTSQPLYGLSELPETQARARRQRALLAVGAIGALALGVVAPSLAEPSRLQAAWGEAARPASVLVGVVAGALAVLTLTRFIGPATRQIRAPEVAARTRALRALAMVGLSLLAMGAFLVVRG